MLRTAKRPDFALQMKWTTQLVWPPGLKPKPTGVQSCVGSIVRIVWPRVWFASHSIMICEPRTKGGIPSVLTSQESLDRRKGFRGALTARREALVAHPQPRAGEKSTGTASCTATALPAAAAYGMERDGQAATRLGSSRFGEP